MKMIVRRRYAVLDQIRGVDPSGVHHRLRVGELIDVDLGPFRVGFESHHEPSAV